MNLHTFRHKNLNLACLPVSPHPQISKPPLLHPCKKLLSDGISRAFADNGIDTTVRAYSRAVPVAVIIRNYPFLYFRGRKNFQTIKTSAYLILFQRFHVVVTEKMRSCNVVHKLITLLLQQLYNYTSESYFCQVLRKMFFLSPPPQRSMDKMQGKASHQRMPFKIPACFKAVVILTGNAYALLCKLSDPFAGGIHHGELCHIPRLEIQCRVELTENIAENL